MASLTFALDHRWAPPRMSAYLEGDMGRRGRRRLERHLSRCAVCTRKLRVLREVLGGLRGLRDEDPAPAPSLTGAVLQRLERDDGPARDGPPG